MQRQSFARPVGWTGTLLIARLLRIAQFVFTVITLGLTARAKDYFVGEPTADYGVAVSVMSLVYLIVIFATSWFVGEAFMVGPILICESLFVIFWLTAFIALAAEYGRGSCDRFYWGEEPCRAGQASIAMAAVCMVLFAATLVLLLLYTVRPVVRTQGSDHLWRTASVMSSSFDRGTGLLIHTSPAWVADPEVGVVAEPQTTVSSGDGAVANEKVLTPTEPEDPALFREPAEVEPVVIVPTTSTH